MLGMSLAFDVLQHFAVTSRGLTPHHGFSGALIWRVGSAPQPLCLRAWPPGDPTAERLAWIHRLIDLADLPFVPALLRTRAGATWIEHADRLWDLSAWMPGVADFKSHPSIPRMEAASVALAQLHTAWATSSFDPQPIPAVLRRLNAHREWLAWSRLLKQLPPLDRYAPELRQLCEQAWSILQSRAELVPRLLAAWTNRSVPVQPCLCDIWHDHVLYDAEKVTGIIDYGGMKIDHVAVDLARMLGSMAGNDRKLWTAGLEAYCRLRPLSASEQELTTILDETGVLMGLATWLKWLYRDGKLFADSGAVAERLEHLLERCRV
jgi:homoserine kinase type II